MHGNEQHIAYIRVTYSQGHAPKILYIYYTEVSLVTRDINKKHLYDP
jgi:hypothetical protein